MSEPLPVRYLQADQVPPADALPQDLQAILSQINDRVAGAQSVEAIVEELFDRMRPWLPCDRLSLAFVSDGGRRLVSYHTRADYEPLRLRAGYSEDIRGSSLAGVIEQGSCRIIDDLEAYLAAKPESRSSRLLVEEGVRSSLTVPLAVDGRSIGVMFRSSRQSGAYGPAEAAAQLAVARRLGQAAEKAYLIEQLRATNQAYTEMLRFVSHELRNPVSAILMETDLLTDGYLGPLTDKQTRRLSNIQSRGQYLLGLISDYLDLARIESGRLTPEIQSVDFQRDVIGEAVEVVGVQAQAKGMSLEVDVSPEVGEVLCDARLMKVVMVNLLGNAAKYGRPGGMIRAEARREAGRIEVSVHNDGPGFPPEQRGRLFQRFSRLDTPELRKEKGSGVGLYAVWHIVGAHGGKVWANSQEGQWARFGFHIPQPPVLEDVEGRR